MSSLEEEIRTTFATYSERSTLEELYTDADATRLYVRDANIPGLLVINAPTKEVTVSPAYRAGKFILQDKASCFPAHLALNSNPKFLVCSDRPREGDLLDACAAPGNKTSHVVSILAANSITSPQKSTRKRIVYACERDAIRSDTLQSMLDRAGAHNVVKVLAKQDFLALDPQDRRFGNVTHLLLDPSCSGSGILSREDVPVLVLPQDPRKRMIGRGRGWDDLAIENETKNGNKKRKRNGPSEKALEHVDLTPLTKKPSIDTDRLQRLSNLQTRIIEHAFTFPSADVVTYSTCSIHAIENEMVVLRVLNSAVARRRCWRLLRRDEQPDGLRKWPHRGDGLDEEMNVGECWDALTIEERNGFTEACIRCKPGGGEGTMGFFVAGFVRDPDTEESSNAKHSTGDGVEQDDQDEWEGFSADEDS